MKSEEILSLKVVNITSGTTIGTVTKLLIDCESKQMMALQLGGGVFSNAVYVPFNDIEAIKNDVVMVKSESSVVDRGTFKSSGIIDELNGRKVLTVDGKDIGTIHNYDIDIITGAITSVTVAIDTAMLGGIWQSVGEPFEIPRSKIMTLGDNVIVDKSVADMPGADKID